MHRTRRCRSGRGGLWSRCVPAPGWLIWPTTITQDRVGGKEARHDFVDQVNGRTYRGHEGIRASVHSYQRLLRDLRFEVVQQVTEGDSVASRFVVHGTHTGRRVRLAGIVVSRFKDGLIVEDFAVTDQVDLLRQLGWWRTLFLMIRRRRSRR